MELPWWFSVGAAAVVYWAIGFLLPSMFSGTAVTAPLSQAAREHDAEGQQPLPASRGDQEQGDGWRLLRSRKGGYVVASWNVGGFEKSATARTFV